MKKILLGLALTVLFCFASGVTDGRRNDTRTQAADVYDLFSEEYVTFYEQEVAKRPVVSNLNPSVLQKNADKYDISVDKLKKVLVLQHAMSQCGSEYTIRELLDMDSSNIVRCAKTYIEYLKKTLSEEELQALAKKLKTLGQE